MATAPTREQPGRSPQGPAPLPAPAQPTPPPLPTGPPHPALQAVGFNGSIHDFNHRLDAAAQAHTTATGTRPTPGLALDLVRSPIPIDHFGPLLNNTSQTMVQARARTALTAAGPTVMADAPPSAHPDPDKQQAQLLAKALDNVNTPEQLNAFLDPSNHDMINAALQGPDTRIVQAAWMRARRRAAAHPQNLSQQGLVGNPGGILDKIVGEGGLAISQIATGLALGLPTLAIAEGKALLKSGSQGITGGGIDSPLVKTNRKLVAGTIQGVKRDVTHPAENPGNLFLDALGLVSAGAGAGVRLAAAGEALRAGEGAAAALRAGARRPVGGTATLRKGNFEEEQLLTENPALRWAQQKLVDTRNARMADRTDEPGPLLSIVHSQRLQDAIDLAIDPIKANFSSENKLGREARVARRIDQTIQMTLKRDLDQVAGWTQTAATAFQRINKQLPERMRGLTVGEQKAIQVLATDDPDPFGAWRQFHQNMIDLEVGDPAAHRAQIAALKLAEKVVADPRPRFVKALELTRQVIEEQQRIKIDELGLRAETARDRVTRVSQMLRGDGTAEKPATSFEGRATSSLQKRLDVLNERYEKLVDNLAAGEGKPGDYRGVTAIQNVANAKSVRRGRGPVYRTVRQQFRDIAETKLLKLVESRPDEPIIKRLRAELDEAAALNKEIALRNDAAIGLHEPSVTPVLPAREPNPDAFYLPFQPKGKPRRATSGRLESFSPQAGPGGIPIPITPNELRHEFTGASIRAGDFRIDATSLAGETYARTVKAATKMNEWRRLWAAGTDTPKNLRFDRPVRDIRDFPDELRGIVNKALDAELTGEEALSLHPADIQDLERFLFPGELINGRWRLDQSIEHVKWVDSRLLDRYRQPLPGAFRTTFQMLNEPFRDFALFLRPAYILNLVGNVGMGLIHQGVLLPPNILRALRVEATHGEQVAKALDALGGASGRSASYAPANLGEGIGKIATTPGRLLAGAWNTITDQHLRRAAIIHELRRQLVALKKDPNDLQSILFDPELKKQRNEGVRRGNKAMVEFDNQTWIEREALRHLIFVYPWQSRALVWSIRTIIEHPVQAAVLDQIGQQAEEEFPDVLKRVPEWFKQIGYVPLGYNKDGSPKVVNPSSINTFSTFSQLLYPLEAGFTSSKYSSFSDLFGPGATFLTHGMTGKDQFGNTYPDGQWLGAAKEVWGQLPQLRAGHQKTGQPLAGLNLGNRNALVRQLNSGLKQTVFTPGWLHGYGTLITGGLTPHGVNPAALEARWYRDLDFAQRHTVEMDLIHRALGLQADLVKEKLPPAVKEAVDLSGARQVAYDALKTQLGRTPTAKEQLQADIGLFEQKAKLNEADAALLQTKLAKITDPLELDRFRAGLYDKYGNAKDLQAWDERVRFVYSFRPEILQAKLAALKAQGLVSSTKLPADQETLYAWGRKALAFYTGAKQRSAAITAARGTSEAPVLEAQLRAWSDQQDKPVTIGGHTFPSPVRMAWANVTPQERAAHIASVVKGSWATLSDFDKELVGRKVPPSMSAAWAEVAKVVHDYKDKYTGASIQRSQLDGLAKEIDRDPRYHGFLADYTFSRQPLVARFEATRVYERMPERDVFDAIVGNDARKAAAAMKSGNYSNSEIRGAWQKYIEEEVVPKIAEHPVLQQFLKPFGLRFLTGLVG